MTEQSNVTETVETSSEVVEQVEVKSPITRRHITILVIVSLTLCVVIITPGIIADYLTAQYLKPKAAMKKHPTDARWKDLIRRKGFALTYEGKHGIRLQGWLIRPRSSVKRFAMYLHDFHRDHRDGYDMVRELLKNGLTVFVFDLRAHGKSQGRVGRNLRLMTDDIRMTLNYLRKMFPNEWSTPVAVIGEGLGGSIGLLTATLDGRFRTVIAMNAPLDAQAQLTQQLKGYPKLLASLTQKRVERVASMRFRSNSILKNVKRLRDTSVMLLGPSSTQKAHQSFCSKTRGQCTYSTIQKIQPNQWWNALPRKRQDAVMVFLLRRLNVPVSKYQMRLRPRIKTKQHKPKIRRRVIRRRVIRRTIHQRLQIRKSVVKKAVKKNTKRSGLIKVKQPTAARIVKKPTSVRVKLGRTLPLLRVVPRKAVLGRPLLRKTNPPTARQTAPPTTQPKKR